MQYNEQKLYGLNDCEKKREDFEMMKDEKV
jgi:hypothetical protein